MIYLIIFNVILSYSLTTSPCFFTVNIPERATNNLNNDLKEINKWDFRRKMNFNPDSTKQALEVIFSRRTAKDIYPKICFNNIPVNKSYSQTHLDMHLDSKLSFGIHMKTILTKVNRIIVLLRKLQQVLPTITHKISETNSSIM